MMRRERLTQPRSINPLGGLPQVSHSSPPASGLGGYISFHNNIKKAAIATSCEPQFEISFNEGVESREEGEEGKLDSKIF
jgi:hypothetical protein